MISDFILFIIGIPLNFLAFILSGFNTAFPIGIDTAITHFIGYSKYLNGYLPMANTILVIEFLMTFYLYMFLFKVFRFVWSLLPFIGKDSNIDFDGNTTSWRSDGRGDGILTRTTKSNKIKISSRKTKGFFR